MLADRRDDDDDDAEDVVSFFVMRLFVDCSMYLLYARYWSSHSVIQSRHTKIKGRNTRVIVGWLGSSLIFVLFGILLSWATLCGLDNDECLLSNCVGSACLHSFSWSSVRILRQIIKTWCQVLRWSNETPSWLQYLYSRIREGARFGDLQSVHPFQQAN